jgi:transposase InsO family protein
MQNGFTKFRWTFPISNQAAQTLYRCVTQLFTTFGAPRQLVTKNGPGYVSQVFTRFLRCWGVKHFTSTPRHPQAKGTRLRCLLSQVQETRLAATLPLWVDLLPSLVIRGSHCGLRRYPTYSSRLSPISNSTICHAAFLSRVFRISYPC